MADPFELFSELLGDGPALPADFDFSTVFSSIDVVPIAGDSGTAAPDAPPVYDPSAIDGLIRDIGTQAGTPPPPFVLANIPASERDPGPFGSVPDDVLPTGADPPTLQLDTDTPPADDVVPIAGDSGDAPPSPPSGIPEAMSADIADTVEDAAGDAAESGGIVAYLVALIRAHPWLATALAVLVLALAVALPVGLSGGGSSPSAADQTTTASAPATTAATPTSTAATTAAVEAPAISAADVSIADFALMLPQGFQFSLQAPASAPDHETVTLDFTGPGLPHTVKVTVSAGHSVPLKYPTTGCGHWTVRVAAIDGTPIVSKGNPALENGMTHSC
ncbi:MAG: hypothetical protein ABUS54_13140 [Actinomycetota bacterium]